MYRKARIFDISEFTGVYPGLKEKLIQIWIDRDNEAEILEYLYEKKKDGKTYVRKDKFHIIIYTIFMSGYDEDLYDWELKSKYVTAMKFKDRSNKRIVCKEFYENGKKIVMICTLTKRSSKGKKNDKKMSNEYSNFGDYDYEFE